MTSGRSRAGGKLAPWGFLGCHNFAWASVRLFGQPLVIASAIVTDRPIAEHLLSTPFLSSRPSAVCARSGPSVSDGFADRDQVCLDLLMKAFLPLALFGLLTGSCSEPQAVEEEIDRGEAVTLCLNRSLAGENFKLGQEGL